VHLSSAAVFGYDAEGWRDESSSYGTRLDGYCRDKKDAEEAIIAHVRPGMAPTAAVLLPTLVYGPYSPFVVDVIRRMSAGRFGLPPRSGSANHVYVDDLVHAMLRAATTPIETVDRFIVSAVPPEPYTAFFERFARMAGIGRVPHAAPRPMEPTAPPSVRRLLRRFAADREFRDLVNRVPGFSYGYQKAKRRWPALTARVTRDVSRPVVAPAASEASGPTLTPNEWTFYSANVTFSGEKAVKTFGAPPVGIDEGMRRTAAWLRHIGLIR
jgi:nucleoside-diphosphate-sugar epimerase